ncbi:hypothetical protein QUF80_02300 [Desulfococcaceae bacterium HSG8]|nr:hypothetical protein [Desulfococcaceae bacterium HSG8]
MIEELQAFRTVLNYKFMSCHEKTGYTSYYIYVFLFARVFLSVVSYKLPVISCLSQRTIDY